MTFHPLTPLFDPTTRFPLMDLVEPPKEVVPRFKQDENVARKVFTVLYDPAQGKTRPRFLLAAPDPWYRN